MDQGIQSLTSEEPKDEKKFPGAGEQIMPGAVCPICHSTDTTAGKEGRPAGQYECNQCGLVYEYHVNIEVLNPESMEVSEDGEKPGIKEPSLPEMPVAAMIDLDKGVMTKVAAAEKKYGHVCAACGMTGCKPIEQSAGRVVYVCPACETRNEKDVLVDSKDASKAVMRIAWTLDPAKIRTAGCDGCKAAALKFVAARKVAAMMKSAASTPFPMANCFERIAKKWGVNAVASYGPCKGKPLADCVCKQLAAFGMRDVGSMNRLAAVYTQEDPMEECVRKHMDGTLGLFTQAQAKLMCGALKRKAMADAATREVNENEFIMAFANGGRHSIEELRIMKQKWAEILGKTAQVGEMDDSTDIGAPIGDVPAEGQETVTIELPATVAQDVAAQVDEATKAPADAEVVDGAPKAPEAPVVAAATATVKVAAKPKVVEKIEGEVEAGIPRGNATIGNEKPPEAKNGPEIPRGDAKLGHEAPLDATLPDIPSDSEFIGGEAEAQKGMPAPDVKLKGTVIAEGKGTVKEAAKPTKVETIEKDVEAGVPRKNETLGNEGKKNIDVDMAKPKIPEGDAKMGGEAPPEATLPDIPADSAYMGGEAEAQKGMPGINTEIKGTVIAGDEARKRQIERIAAARTMKANSVLSRLMGEGRIRVSSQQEFERLATDLSQIPLDRIEAFAERLCQPAPVVKQASAQVPALAAPIVQEASSYVDEKKPEAQPTVVEQMRSWFTVGSKELDAEVRKQR